ncbi:MAG: hypothetical protein Q8736_02685, partial [Sweet potato little leaf phytoplasma]|nr:hypothetical protein [Sweet potato little leaf phytoplasma]
VLEASWRQRNKFVFEAEPLNPNNYCYMQVKHMVEAIRSSLSSKNGVVATSMKGNDGEVCWSFPLTGWVKINTNGSYYPSTDIATCGGAMHDASGNFMVAFSAKTGSYSILMTKLRGILHGAR